MDPFQGKPRGFAADGAPGGPISVRPAPEGENALQLRVGLRFAHENARFPAVFGQNLRFPLTHGAFQMNFRMGGQGGSGNFGYVDFLHALAPQLILRQNGHGIRRGAEGKTDQQ